MKALQLFSKSDVTELVKAYSSESFMNQRKHLMIYIIFRVGDNLLAINNNLLSGKPVSYVTKLIRSIPCGKVEVLVRSFPADLLAERKQSLQNSEVTLCDSDSSVSTVTNATDHQSNDATLFSLPLPTDKN